MNTKFILKPFYYIFYNTNFLVNSLVLYCTIILFIPFITTKNILLEFIIYSGTFLFTYQWIYILNDLIDTKKDISSNIYKNDVRSKYEYKYAFVNFFIIFLLINAFFLFFNLKSSYINIFFTFITVISIIHSLYPNIKIFTITIERLIRFLIPFFSLCIIYKDYSYIIVGLFYYPLAMNIYLEQYLKLKLQITNILKYKIILYTIYYLVIYLFIKEITFYQINLLAIYMLIELATTLITQNKINQNKNINYYRNHLLIRTMLTTIILIFSLYVNSRF